MAPSPTGHVHLGSARTALFNLLFARGRAGTFILRIDDTDLGRNRPEFEAGVYAGFRWLGLDWDEGPDRGGDAGPYRQSERLDLYRQEAARLLEEGRAYRCYCTPEELAEQRRAAERERRAYVYNRRCLISPPADRVGHGEFTVRFQVPAVEVAFDDVIRGETRFDAGLIGDFVIMKSDGGPTYNFASPVDDALMGITHVLRGEEHISNTPGQLLVLDALGHPRPQAFAHLPLILMPDGTKMSKRRHPEADLMRYRGWGYLPEALVNYLALLGWNPGTEREMFSFDDLVGAFDLARVQRSGAVFDRKKLDWINGQYIRNLDDGALLSALTDFLPGLAGDRLRLAVPALRERMTRLDRAPELLAYLGSRPAGVRLEGAEGAAVRDVVAALRGVEWLPEPIEAALESLRERSGLSRNRLYGPIRQAVTGGDSPPIHYTLALLPKEEAMSRLEEAIS